MSTITKLVILLLISVLAITGSVGAQSTADDEDEIRIVYISHGETQDDGFWHIVETGMNAAAADLGVTAVYHPTDYSTGTMAALIDEAVANEVDGIVVSIFEAETLGPPIMAAVEAGIPVIAVNQGFDTAAELGALAYIGEDPYTVGYAGGERLAAADATYALCINPAPGIPILDQRCQGVSDAMDAVGKTVEVLPVDGTNPSGAVERISEALSANPQIDAILSLGPFPAELALEALDESGLLGEIMMATFDLSPQVLEAIQDGDMLFAIDQQPYLQGYLPVLYLTLYARNLNTPASPVIPTSPGFITEDNVEEVMALVEAGTR